MNSPNDDDTRRVIFALGGCPGVGKSTVQETLLRTYPDCVAFVRRMTDRPLRADEHTSALWSVPQADFARMYHAGEVAAAFGANNHLYGVSLLEISEILARGVRWVGTISASVAVALRPFTQLVPGFPRVVHVYLRVHDPMTLCARLARRGHTPHEIDTRMHEFFDTDAAWAALADHVIYTDRGVTVGDTVREVASTLKLPPRSPAPII